jgi:hypothetical protein
VLRKIERHGNDDHAEEEEEEGIYAHCQGCSCLRHAIRGAEFRTHWKSADVLKMNFSVGVNM